MSSISTSLPVEHGSVTAIAAAIAMQASTALPPLRKMSRPACLLAVEYPSLIRGFLWFFRVGKFFTCDHRYSIRFLFFSLSLICTHNAQVELMLQHHLSTLDSESTSSPSMLQSIKTAVMMGFRYLRCKRLGRRAHAVGAHHRRSRKAPERKVERQHRVCAREFAISCHFSVRLA